ncbi:MAG: hypothetical protein HYV36_06830 [Lentisphaerae bacterium]|nr:hypothetical protein [Lentisphaerota bacterium]
MKWHVTTLAALLILTGCATSSIRPPDDFLAGPGWRARMIREIKLTRNYNNQTISSVLSDLSDNNGVRGGLLDRSETGNHTARVSLSVTDATVREILWTITQETGTRIELHPKGRAFTVEIP